MYTASKSRDNAEPGSRGLNAAQRVWAVMLVFGVLSMLLGRASSSASVPRETGQMLTNLDFNAQIRTSNAVALPAHMMWPWDSTIRDVKWTSGPHSYSKGGQLNVTVPIQYANGLDFARPNGETWAVTPMAAGTVIKNRCYGGTGLGCIVAIRHDDGGTVMVYAHLRPNNSSTAPENTVVEGGFYGPGAIIGYVGSSGNQ